MTVSDAVRNVRGVSGELLSGFLPYYLDAINGTGGADVNGYPKTPALFCTTLRLFLSDDQGQYFASDIVFERNNEKIKSCQFAGRHSAHASGTDAAMSMRRMIDKIDSISPGMYGMF